MRARTPRASRSAGRPRKGSIRRRAVRGLPFPGAGGGIRGLTGRALQTTVSPAAVPSARNPGNGVHKYMREKMSTRPSGSLASWRRTIGAVAFGCVLALGCRATLAAPPTQEEVDELKAKLDQSLRLIDKMNQRLQTLEKAAAASAAPASGPAPGEWGTAVTKRVSDLEQEVSALGTRSNPQEGIPLHGFLDVGALSTTQRGVSHKGATADGLDLYLTTENGRVRSLTELNFEVNREGQIDTDLERIQIGYAVSDALTFWAGRFHSPYGYWNTAYHHGAQIQPSILRPRFLDFEDKGGILPAHDVGLWATGRLPIGDTLLHYDAWLANAPRVGSDGILDQNVAGATNGHALVGMNLGLPVGGATLGVHALTGRIGSQVDGQSITDLRILGGYAVYEEDNWEAMAEYFGFMDRNVAGGGVYTSHAAYAHVGRAFGAWTPYVRYELATLDQGDQYFASMIGGQSYRRAMLGVRYDIDPRSTLKLEFDHTRLTDRIRDAYRESRIQYAIRF